mmetsp:Transcript_12591/g.24655  ORF Transcript_12591/g.24655 Transcript_12591/m.24655 type:complete len:246 (-) Transcript_12591:740-1477(-)
MARGIVRDGSCQTANMVFRRFQTTTTQESSADCLASVAGAGHCLPSWITVRSGPPPCCPGRPSRHTLRCRAPETRCVSGAILEHELLSRPLNEPRHAVYFRHVFSATNFPHRHRASATAQQRFMGALCRRNPWHMRRGDNAASSCRDPTSSPYPVALLPPLSTMAFFVANGGANQLWSSTAGSQWATHHGAPWPRRLAWPGTLDSIFHCRAHDVRCAERREGNGRCARAGFGDRSRWCHSPASGL